MNRLLTLLLTLHLSLDARLRARDCRMYVVGVRRPPCPCPCCDDGGNLQTPFPVGIMGARWPPQAAQEVHLGQHPPPPGPC